MSAAFWKDRPVLVTGGRGLIGKWLVAALRRRGARTLVLARQASSVHGDFRNDWGGDVAVVQGELTDGHLLRRCIESHDVDTIFHLAAQPLSGVALRDPAGTLEANVRGTWTVLEAARSTRRCRVLVASSGKVYDATAGCAHREDNPLRGDHPYDVSKTCVDLTAAMYAHSYDLPVGTIRCSNVFGGGDSNFSRVVPGVVLATLRGEPFVIRSDGKGRHAYLYVEDAVKGYLRLAEMLEGDQSLSGEAFNLSLDRRFSVLDIVESVLRIAGRPDLRPIVLGQGSEDAPDQYLIVEKARRVLGWRPRYGLEEGLRKTIHWYRENLAGSADRTCSSAAS